MTENMNQTTGGGVLLVADDQRIKELFAKLNPTQKKLFISQAAYFLEAQSWPSSALELPVAVNL